MYNNKTKISKNKRLNNYAINNKFKKNWKKSKFLMKIKNYCKIK